MKGKTARLLCICTALLALSLAWAGSAYTSVHVTSVNAISDTLSASLVSTGDSGFNHGNENWSMSPVLPVPPTGFSGWFNQDVSFGSLSIIDPDFDGDVLLGGQWYNFSADGVSWGLPVSFTGTRTVSTEGLYSLTATGTDDVEEGELATGTLPVAFGIDKTKPMSSTDLPAVPAFDSDAFPVFTGGMATVTITATDTLSGVENMQYSVDGGPFDYAWDADAGQMFSVPVTVTRAGLNTLRWRVFDNAGNVETNQASFIVRPVGFIQTLAFGVTKSGTGGRKVRFAGDVDAMPTVTTVTLTVQRFTRGKFRPFNTYHTTVPANLDDWAISKSFPAHSRFRAMASNGMGYSTLWLGFTTK